MKNRNDERDVLCRKWIRFSPKRKHRTSLFSVELCTIFGILYRTEHKVHTMNLRERVNFKFGEWDMRYHIFHDRNLSSYDNQIYNCWINGWLTKLCCCCYFLFFSFFYLYFRTNRLLPDTCIMTQCSSLWRNHCTSSLYSLINKFKF